MGLFNELFTVRECPRCKKVSPIVVEFKFGDVNLHKYLIGEQLRLTEKSHGQESHFFQGNGYAVCFNCEKDFWVKILVENHILVAVEHDKSKSGFIE